MSKAEKLFLIGCDLGKMVDYTALSGVEKTTEISALGKRQPATYKVGHLERIPLGTPYTAVVKHVAKLLQQFEAAGQWDDIRLVVDAGGPGPAVLDMFKEGGLSPIAVRSHAGQSVTKDENGYGVPKRDLVFKLLAAYQQDRVQVVQRLRYANVLVDELLNFRSNYTPAGNDTYAAREGAHDDLIVSVALAVWYGERFGGLSYTKWLRDQFGDAAERVKNAGREAMAKLERPEAGPDAAEGLTGIDYLQARGYNVHKRSRWKPDETHRDQRQYPGPWWPGD